MLLFHVRWDERFNRVDVFNFNLNFVSASGNLVDYLCQQIDSMCIIRSSFVIMVIKD